MTDPVNPYSPQAMAAKAQTQFGTAAPLGTQVNNWVNQSAQGMPALNPGAGGPIHGQQIPAPNGTAIPAAPGAAPAVALPPGAVTPVEAADPIHGTAVPNAQFPPQPDNLAHQKEEKLPYDEGNPALAGRWQDHLAAMQQNNPNRYAHMFPMMQHLMQRRGFQFTPPQAAPNTAFPLNPNPVG